MGATRFLNKNNKGSSLIQDKRALRPVLGKGGFVLGKGAVMSLLKSYEHLGLIGPTGSGKSATFFIPNLMELPLGVSAVVTDPKGELYWKTGADLRARGFDTIRLAPFERFYPGYNMLAVAKDYAEIKEIAQLILMNGGLAFEMQGKGGGDATWLNMSLPLLVAAFLYEKKMEPGCPKIGKAMEKILYLDMEEMEAVFDQVEIARREFNLFKQAAGSEKILASIKVTIATNMQLFMDDKIVKFAERNDLHPSFLRHGLDGTNQKPVVLFVSVPETKSLYAAPLMAVIYQQLLQRLQDIIDGFPVLFLLDEFANIGIVPIIDTVAATARSRRMGLAIGLQGVEQLNQKYGEDKANNLLNNLKTKVFLSGLSLVSCEYASSFCGTATIAQENITRSFFSFMPKQKMQSFAERAAMTPDEVRRLNPDKALVISDYLDPAIIDKIWYYQESKYTSRIRWGDPDFSEELDEMRNRYNIDPNDDPGDSDFFAL
ncbi:type IV secretion system protein VirD4 [Paenibacillus sp. PastF-3]|uniref:type IV secretory system conjugative DNA transfer family protein n=1 Tax=Paenibacillus sp. PastF-3 TaxID=2940626 RepID=UPI002474643F|nr:type IV secretory system conjugative DNA transfer family protein [Paenibacillus sp. PastF-3]MDH6372804.1 type IV secretion system protein VirD4 [Paenibacillus sp. PastF-3]